MRAPAMNNGIELSRQLAQRGAQIAAIGLAIVCAGCSADAATEPGADTERGPAYLLMHTVSTDDDRQNYVHVVPSLDVGELDDSKGREMNGLARSFVMGGDVYIADGEALSVERFEVANDLTLKPKGKVSFANRGLTFFSDGSLFVSDERAYYMNTEQLEVIVWNPKTMEITGSIDLSSLKVSDYADFGVVGSTRVGDRLFVTYWNDDWVAGKMDPSVTVAILSTTEDKLLGSMRDERCAHAWPGSVLPDGNFYIAGTAAGADWPLVLEAPPAPNCVLRVLEGESSFDPDFVKQMDDILDPLTGGNTFEYASELGGVVVWAHEQDEFADADDFYARSVWRPLLVDPEKWTSQVIDDSLTNVGWLGDTIVVDGEAHFTTTTADGQGELVRYKDGKLTSRLSFSSWLQVVERIR